MKLTAKLWNELYKPGQEVYYYPVLRSDFTPDDSFEPGITETRSVAWETPSGSHLVSVFGKTGGVSLAHLAIKVEK